ncbi:hypothetical protein [Sulfuracidifex metallicus]|uniref:hypothetical protein n=1 Tax=Sulfuracidifex metallicus TaxID=47303 RepID=UPI0006D1F679|nr:hypothetical protein [Sulfuracidifex metallicus]
MVIFPFLFFSSYFFDLSLSKKFISTWSTCIISPIKRETRPTTSDSSPRTDIITREDIKLNN